MKKLEAITLFGGSAANLARAVAVSPQAVHKWPDELPARIADRVQAALWRLRDGAQGPGEASAEVGVVEQAKLVATLRAQAAIAGFVLSQAEDGTFVVARWNLFRHLRDTNDVVDFLVKVGARKAGGA